MISSYIGLYYYCALTNYWSQYYLPKIEEFDASNSFHALVQRVVDQSAADFVAMGQLLSRVNHTQLQQSSLAHLLTEAITFWRDRVRNSTQVFAARARDES